MGGAFVFGAQALLGGNQTKDLAGTPCATNTTIPCPTGQKGDAPT